MALAEVKRTRLLCMLVFGYVILAGSGLASSLDRSLLSMPYLLPSMVIRMLRRMERIMVRRMEIRSVSRMVIRKR